MDLPSIVVFQLRTRGRIDFFLFSQFNLECGISLISRDISIFDISGSDMDSRTGWRTRKYFGDGARVTVVFKKASFTFPSLANIEACITVSMCHLNGTAVFMGGSSRLEQSDDFSP